MFSIFNKKKSSNTEKSAEFNALVERWDVFLTKIETLFQELIIQAEETVLESLEETNFDPIPTQRVWMSIKQQILGLTEKIDKTWDEKVKPEFATIAKSYEYTDQFVKGDNLSLYILNELDKHEVLIEGKVAHKFYDYAMKFQNQNFNCTQCGAKLEIEKDIFISHYVACHYCGTTNTFLPNTKVAQIQWFAVDKIAKRNALELQEAMQNSYLKIQEYRLGEAPTEAINDYENKYLNYWKTYLNERIQLSSLCKETYEDDIKRRILEFNNWKKTYKN